MKSSFNPFVSEHVLEDHTESVNVLAFSPTGSRLASGSQDGSLVIWEPITGVTKYRIVCPSAVLSLAWDPRHLNRLFVGCENGDLAVLNNFEAHELCASVLTGLNASIFALAIDYYTGDVAVAVGSEVHVAKEIGPREYATVKILPAPAELFNVTEPADKRVRGRAVAFKAKGSELVVTYLNHGVLCWDVSTLQCLWQIHPIHGHRLIGHAALALDEKKVIISNLGEGVDVYFSGRSHPDLRLKNRPISEDRNLPLQVSFVLGGLAIICGSSDGRVPIWVASSGECLQLLEHGGHIVQAIAAFDFPFYTLVATGTSCTGEGTFVKIWKNQDNNILSACSKVVRLYIWTRHLEISTTLRSLLSKRVPVSLVIIIASVLLAAMGCTYATYNSITAAFPLQEFAQFNFNHVNWHYLWSTLSTAVRRCALNGIEYLSEKLRVDETPDVIYL